MIEATATVSPAKAFEALGHETRLAVFRLLIPAGADGLTPGVIAERTGLAPSALSFHLARLANAGLVRSRRRGRHLHYAVRYEQLAGLVEFLAGDCCRDVPTGCLPECPAPAAPARSGAGCCADTAPEPEKRR